MIHAKFFPDESQALLEFPVHSLAARGRISARDAAELVWRVRRHRALQRWRGVCENGAGAATGDEMKLTLVRSLAPATSTPPGH